MTKNLIIAALLAAVAWLAGQLYWQAGEAPRQAPPVDAGTQAPAALPSPPASDDETAVPELEPEPLPEPDRFQGIRDTLAAMGGDPGLAGMAFGFCLLDPLGAPVVAENAGVGLIPASSLKTVTAAAALEILGPEFRFETKLIATGDLDAATGALAGDLVIAGGGDPTLADADLRGWVEAVRQRGINSVAGSVVGDGSIFPGEPVGDFWGWGDVGNGYGSPASGLNFNHNRFVARFRAGAAEGDPAAFLGASPEVPGGEFANFVTTGAPGSGDGVMIYGGPNAARLHLRGTVPPGADAFPVTGAAPDPPRFAAHAFSNALREAGIEVQGGVSVGRVAEPDGAPLLVHQSAPLIEILGHLLEVSDNHEAECVFKMLGVVAHRPPADAIRDHWAARGLDLSRARIVDGSGLSRANFIAADDLSRLQFLAASGDHGALYAEALNAHFGGKVRWKGGAMSSVRSYTGLVESASGERFAFAMLFNHYQDARAVSRWRDALVRAIMEVE